MTLREPNKLRNFRQAQRSKLEEVKVGQTGNLFSLSLTELTQLLVVFSDSLLVYSSLSLFLWRSFSDFQLNNQSNNSYNNKEVG